MDKQQIISRPMGFEKERRDCTVRALSLSSNRSYADVHDVFKQYGRKDGHRTRTAKIMQKVFHILKLNAKQIKRSGRVNSLIKKYPKGHIFCLTHGHAFAIIDGVAHDLRSLNQHIKGAWLIEKNV